MTTPKAKPQLHVCNYAIGNVVCTRPAIIRIDRGRWGELRVCSVHMNLPEIYADVKANGWSWDTISG